MAPLLKLGSVLTEVRRDARSGTITVKEGDLIHGIAVHAGAIFAVKIGGEPLGHRMKNAPFSIHEEAARLFSLERPLVVFEQTKVVSPGPRMVDPLKVVLSGVTARRDLFDPRNLVQRIPVGSLVIPPDKHRLLSKLPFTREERDFIGRLCVPTPVTMALWKRGLPPRSAGALLVALNLLGVWEERWAPGLLPRLTSAVRVLGKMRSRCEAWEILGVDRDAPDRDQDKAFRKLSLELHPDRVRHLPASEAKMANEAFEGVSRAYQELKSSRRRRPVRVPNGESIGKIRLKTPDTWEELYRQAVHLAEVGDAVRARLFALKALAKNPPEEYRVRLTTLLSSVA